MTKRTGSTCSKQTGNVMLSVMVISAILMGIGATLYNNYIVSEAEAVEKSLVDTRTYWAMIGNANLLLGRISGQGIPCNWSISVGNLQTNADQTDSTPTTKCTGDGVRVGSASISDSVRIGAMQYYFDESTQFHDADDSSVGARSITKPGTKIWKYPIEPFDPGNMGLYSIYIGSSIEKVADLPSGSAKYTTDTGRFRIDLSAKKADGSPVVLDLVTRFPTLTVGFCVVDQSGHTIDPGTGKQIPNTPYLVGSSCGAPPSGVGTIAEGYNQIQFLQWNMKTPDP